jgi:hypothetical protein
MIPELGASRGLPKAPIWKRLELAEDWPPVVKPSMDNRFDLKFAAGTVWQRLGDHLPRLEHRHGQRAIAADLAGGKGGDTGLCQTESWVVAEQHREFGIDVIKDFADLYKISFSTRRDTVASRPR